MWFKLSKLLMSAWETIGHKLHHFSCLFLLVDIIYEKDFFHNFLFCCGKQQQRGGMLTSQLEWSGQLCQGIR